VLVRVAFGTTSSWLNMDVTDIKKGKVLTLYLNSILTVIQLIAFLAETEGAYVTLHGKQVWPKYNDIYNQKKLLCYRTHSEKARKEDFLIRRLSKDSSITYHFLAHLTK